MPIDDRVRDAVDAFVARVRQDMEAHAGTLSADILRAVRTATDAEAEAVANDAGQGQLVSGVRRLEKAATLSDILDVLLDSVSGQASRAAVWLVDGAHVSLWNSRGFVDAAGPADPPTLDASSSPTSGTRHSAGAMVVPLVVGGNVVAVLQAADDVDSVGWREATELLARHAAICLERVTSARTVELLARPG
jgi:hypothetical protein